MKEGVRRGISGDPDKASHKEGIGHELTSE
jgi:hypothetical protein